MRSRRDRLGPARSPTTRVLVAWLLISVGQWAFTVATGVFAFHVSGAAGTSAVTVARLAPAVFAAPLAGALVDRVSRAMVVTASCLVQALALVSAAGTALAGGSLGLLVVAMVVASVAGTPCRPALQAVLPALAATPEELTRATAGWSAVDSIGFLAGAGLGGLAIAMTGTGTVMAVAGGLLLAAAVLTARLPTVRATLADEDGDEDGAAGGSALLGGLQAIRDTPMLHVPLLLFVGLLLLEGTSDVQLTALAIGRLHLGSGGPGLLYAVWGFGGLLGSGVLVVVVRRRGYGLALFGGALTYAALLGLCGYGGVPVALATLVPVGVGFSLVENAVMGIMPRLADDEVLGRVYGITELMYAGVAAVGAALAPALIAVLGVPGSLLAVGAAFAVAALLTWRACARLDQGEQTAARVRALLRGVPFLGALPLPRLERLVRVATPVRATSGTTIFRAGEPGTDFLVIERGEVQIVEYARRQTSGEGFGEIALLRDVPRTATVRAMTDTDLWSIRRSSFLAAVGASEDIARAADAIVERHLARPRTPPPSRPGAPG